MKESYTISKEILSLAESWEEKLLSLPEETIARRRNSQNRTIKQIFGAPDRFSVQ